MDDDLLWLLKRYVGIYANNAKFSFILTNSNNSREIEIKMAISFNLTHTGWG